MASEKSSSKLVIYALIIVFLLVVFLPVFVGSNGLFFYLELAGFFFLLLLTFIGLFGYKNAWGERVLFFVFLFYILNLMLLWIFRGDLLILPLLFSLLGFVISLPKKMDFVPEKVHDEKVHDQAAQKSSHTAQRSSLPVQPAPKSYSEIFDPVVEDSVVEKASSNISEKISSKIAEQSSDKSNMGSGQKRKIKFKSIVNSNAMKNAMKNLNVMKETAAKEKDSKSFYDSSSSVQTAPVSAKAKYSPGKLVASKSSNVYHFPKCDWAQKIHNDRRLWFPSKEAAEGKGFKAHSCVE